jgi:3-oxoacyl-[acyl-carrier-protein] synthase-1
MQPLAIISSGMVTGVGLSAPAACAAIRCAIDGFNETRFMDKGGEWIIGCEVPLDQPWRGMAKLVNMALPAIRECLAAAPRVASERIPLLLCVAEKDRPGRLAGLDDRLLSEIIAALNIRFHPSSTVIARGRVAAAEAMALARNLIYRESVPCCLIVGVDSMLIGATLATYEEAAHLLTSVNSDGFIPGEAAAAVIVALPTISGGAGNTHQLICLGLGFGDEASTIDSEKPLRADGMVAAFRGAMTDAGKTLADTDYRLTDLNGTQYAFKEAALAMNRLLRTQKDLYEIWHPADCIGETGAAIGPCVLGVALAAARKAYAPGPGVLCHFGNEDGRRAAMILSYSHVRGAN